MGFARAAVRTPLTGRTRSEFLFCLLGLPFGVFVPLAGFFATALLAVHASGTPLAAKGNPSWLAVVIAAVVAAMLTVLLVATGAARGMARACEQ